jgi:ssDNA-binding Zn-finger/Zn-ribbon topoisomerase 1
MKDHEDPRLDPRTKSVHECPVCGHGLTLIEHRVTRKPLALECPVCNIGINLVKRRKPRRS